MQVLEQLAVAGEARAMLVLRVAQVLRGMLALDVH